jgi:hypothetical protein
MTTASGFGAQAAPRTRYLRVGLAASVAHLLLMIPGYTDDGRLQATAYAIVVAISLAVTMLIFLLVVPKAGAVTAVVLGVLAVLTVLAFWLAVTLPLAAAAVVVAVGERAHGRHVGMATAGAALGVIGALLTVAIIISDAVSTT